MNFLPCPFCGKSEAIVLQSSGEYELENFEIDSGNDGQWHVVCAANKIGKNGRMGCGASTGFSNSEEEAIEYWNTRG